MRGKIFLLLAAVGFAGGAFAQGADGGALYKSKGCLACHGADGSTPTVPTYPKLAGQTEAYLLNQMKDIASGARNNGQTALMKPIVAVLSEGELAAIAKWLSEQPAK